MAIGIVRIPLWPTIADSGGNFPDSSNLVADLTITATQYLPASYNRQKIYFGTDPLSNYPSAVNANNDIVAAINSGRLFVNYHGHATVSSWSGELLLQLSDLTKHEQCRQVSHHVADDVSGRSVSLTQPHKASARASSAWPMQAQSPVGRPLAREPATDTKYLDRFL